MKNRYQESIIGCLLGTAVGDALGLPYEKLSRTRIYKSHTPIKGHSLVLDKGMISDDTEHLCMSAQSLIVSGGDPTKFTHYLAWRLRFWLLGFPAGIGLATLKSCLRLLLGFSPQKSGVNSAGNGAAIRSAIIGVCYGSDPPRLMALVKASTNITHDNHKAELGAIAVAVAAYLASSGSFVAPDDYYQTLQKFLAYSSTKLTDLEISVFLSLIEQVCTSVKQQESGVTFAAKLANNKGISGYIYNTVPIVIQVWLRNQDNYSQAVREIIYLGGDTDTTAAILGGIIGASVGVSGIPRKWLDDLIDFPRSVAWMISLGGRLALTCETNIAQPPLPLAFYWLPLRNLIFLIAILFHAFYRLLPPY
ncbi:MAG: ADP-ribosylglycohydrolase family protein [Pleurocapsa sp. MO_226.B13]|nr:ADP-ribosylglycohydrolase family protein [Pleurocapsa sp. MO_226.B13]